MMKAFLVIGALLAGICIGVVVDEQIQSKKLQKFSPQFSETLPSVRMKIGNQEFEIRLYESKAARNLLDQLPQRVVLKRWGNGEYQGPLAKVIATGEKTRRAFLEGEAGLWLQGNAFSVFFGPTPASLTTNTPMMASSGIPLGRIISSFGALRDMPEEVDADLSIMYPK